MSAEIVTAWTDAALAVELSVFAVLVLRRRTSLARMAGLLFAALAIAAATGGVYHATIDGSWAALAPSIWKISLVAMGAAGLACWQLGAEIALAGSASRAVRIASSIGFVGYTLAVGAGAHDFRWAVVATGTGTLFLLACCCIGPLCRGRRLLAAGLCLSLAGAGIQQLGVGLHTSFDHNALYHGLEMLAMALVFAGVSRLPGSAQEETPC